MFVFVIPADAQVIALVQCTSPFILPEYLQLASDRMASGKCDAVFSVTRTHQLRWSVAENDNFAAKPLNFDPKNRPRRQDWQGEFVENGNLITFLSNRWKILIT